MAIVLLVEDNATNRKLLRDILEIRFQVIEAIQAEDALELLTEQKPDLILTDLKLPGMDGLSFVKKIKSDPSTASIPIVAVSAHAMQENIDEAHAVGCLDYVTKPLTEDPFQFVERMERLVTDSV